MRLSTIDGPAFDAQVSDAGVSNNLYPLMQVFESFFLSSTRMLYL